MMSYLRTGLVLLALLIIASPALAASPPSPGGWTGNANVFFGGKFLNSDDWAPADKQIEGGLLLDARPRFWPINLALDVLYGAGSERSFDSKILEVDLGVRKIWDEIPVPVRPFVGGGPSITRATASGVFRSISGTGAGLWVDGGVYVTLAEHFNLGVESRLSYTWVDIAGITVDGGGYHLGLIAGAHW